MSKAERLGAKVVLVVLLLGMLVASGLLGNDPQPFWLLIGGVLAALTYTMLRVDA